MFSFDVEYGTEDNTIKFESNTEFDTRAEAATAAAKFDAFMFDEVGEEGRFKIVELKKVASIREAA